MLPAETSNLIATTLVTAVVSAAVNFLGWLVLRRSIERQDAEIDSQRKDLQTLRDERIAGLAKRIADHERDSSAQRRGIYERLNDAVRPDDFHRRTAAIDKSVAAVAEDVSFLRAEVASQGSVLKLIASNMGIHFGTGEKS